MQSLRLQQSSLFFVKLNEQCVNNEHPEGVCLFNLVVNNFLGLTRHVLIFQTKTVSQHK